MWGCKANQEAMVVVERIRCVWKVVVVVVGDGGTGGHRARGWRWV